MAHIVGDVAVSGLVELILKKLGSALFTEVAQILGVVEELKRLQKILTAINTVLLDAEQQQSASNCIRNWLLNLKDVAYDIEDLLDIISTQDLEWKLNGTSLGGKITKLFSRYGLVQEMKAICRKLGNIADDRRNYNFHEHQPLPPIEANCGRESYSSIQESYIYGRDQDKEWIITHLLGTSSHLIQQTPVIPIIGIGGMGKTTLAKLAFNDPRVIQVFDLRLWAYVSNKFVLKTVIENIIQSTTGQSYSHLNMEALQKLLHGILAGQTFLAILDDVWIEDSKQWMELKHLLVEGSKRSAIIVTTREERVASITGTIKAYRLQGLSDDHCWFIFLKYAFSEHEEKAHPLLVQIGKSIIQKCRGVPLAVKTLGSLLRNERDYCTWKQIKESELWMIGQRANDVLPALKLSFDHTPYHLRSCFASCAILRKCDPLFRNKLICLWMAQGLLQSQQGSEDAIDVGHRYFNELISRSFFQLPGCSLKEELVMRIAEMQNWLHGWANLPQMCTMDETSQVFRSIDGQVRCVEMHDLVHDLAAYVAGEETATVSSYGHEISSRVKHLVWDKEDLSGKVFSEFLLKARKARTFAFQGPMGSISKSFLERLVSNFRCLRILVLSHSEFEELPDSIGDLKHLRYLDVHQNFRLKFLPNSTCKLVNLQTLDVGFCLRLEMLPKDVHRLVNLRILVLTLTLTCLPKRGFECWSSLQILKITYCPNLVSLSEGLESLKCLRVLIIRVCEELVSLPNNMRNLTSLEHITIHSCKELDLAGWKGLCDLRSLRVLAIFGLPKLSNFPDGIGCAISSLHYLGINMCSGLRALPEGLKQCTSLLKLEVFNCPNLSSLPSGIDGLKALQELRVFGCPELSRRCEREIGDDWHLISHIPEIYIDEKVIQNRVPETMQGQAGTF